MVAFGMDKSNKLHSCRQRRAWSARDRSWQLLTMRRHVAFGPDAATPPLSSGFYPRPLLLERHSCTLIPNHLQIAGYNLTPLFQEH